jgi:hypothetical protein
MEEEPDAVYPSRRRITLLAILTSICGGATDTLLQVRPRYASWNKSKHLKNGFAAA